MDRSCTHVIHWDVRISLSIISCDITRYWLVIWLVGSSCTCLLWWASKIVYDFVYSLNLLVISRCYHCNLVWEENEGEREGGRGRDGEREGERLEVLVYSAVTSHDVGLWSETWFPCMCAWLHVCYSIMSTQGGKRPIYFSFDRLVPFRRIWLVVFTYLSFLGTLMRAMCLVVFQKLVCWH